MKKWLAILGILAVAGISQGQNVIDSWDFNVPDTNSLSASLSTSDLGAGGETWPDKTLVSSITGSNAVFFGGGVANSQNYFANASGLSARANEESGTYQLSVDLVSADFSNTAAQDQKATWAIGFRGGADGSADNMVRIKYQGELGVTNVSSGGVTNILPDADHIEILASARDISWNEVDVTVPGSSFSGLNLRQVYDLDADTYEAYYTLPPASEVLLYSGALTDDFILKDLRIAAQMNNGGSIWEAGDDLIVAKIELTELVAPIEVDPYTLIEQWDFAGDSLIGVNSNRFPDATNSVWNDIPGDDALTMSPDADEYQTKNFTITPGNEDIYISWTLDSFDLSDLTTINSSAYFGLLGADHIGVQLYLDNQTNTWAAIRSGLGQVVKARVIKGGAVGTGPLQITARLDFVESEVQLFVSNDGNWLNWSAVQWADPAVISNAYTAGFDFSTVLTNGVFEKTRMAVTGFDPSEQVTADQVFIKEEPVTEFIPAVSIVDQFGGGLDNVPGVAPLGTFTDVQPNDVMVLLAAGSNNKHITPNAASFISLDGGVVSTNVLFQKSAVGVWYAPVQTGGTFDVSFTKTNNYTSVGVYLVRADSGGVLSIDTQSRYEAPGASSISLSYSFGAVASDGVVLEALSSAASGGSSPDDVLLDYFNGPPVTRAVGSSDFGNVSALNTSWTITQGVPTKNASLAGIALYVDYVPPLGTPTEAYAYWVSGYPTLTETLMLDNQDNDNYVNLSEYAWGGSPVDAFDNGNTPEQSIVLDGGTEYLQHVYFERDNAAARGLTSAVEVGTGLIPTDWTTAGVEFVGSGAAAGVPGYNAVTNRTPVSGTKRFLRVETTFTP